ncbi:uncharacterized protein LOC124168807 [Ischnura elegans]|uniref:uncharacterized protein LOC124168807 n=1 Tax=Ischnura elegans TaxID=197161 RepID=UPI001ED8BADF|nr:uncharacterized protein LOC124168807 [Ischnura elegans]
MSLANTLDKVFMGVLVDRMLPWALRRKRLSFPTQKGFIPATKGCSEHNFVLQSAIEHARASFGQVAVAWLDLADASPSVPHDHILRVLREIGLPVKCVAVIEHMLRGSTMTVAASGGITNSITVTSGVRQGVPFPFYCLTLRKSLYCERFWRIALSKAFPCHDEIIRLLVAELPQWWEMRINQRVLCDE